MALHRQGKFSITQVPAHPLPLPRRLERVGFHEVVVRGDAFRCSIEQDQPPGERSFVDLHFRLARLDPTAEHGPIALMREHGPLGLFTAEELFEAQDDHPPGSRLWSWPLVEDAPRRLWDERRRVLGERDAADSFASTRLEWRCGIAVMQDLITCRHVALDDAPLPDEWSSPAWLLHLPSTRGDAALMLTSMINPALEAFHPRVEVIFPDAGEFEGYRVERPIDQCLWDLAIASLWNDLYERRTYRHCASETCGRLFQRQLGGARHAQHREEGILYCTPGCARAQAQREYRRRQRRGREPGA